MMGSRAERRRQERTARKDDKVIEGVKYSRLRLAKDDLEASVPAANDEHFVMDFAVLLNDWQSAEYTCAELRTQYRRTGKLKDRGRKVDLDPTVKRYAECREEQELILEQMLEVLEALEAQPEGDNEDKPDLDRIEPDAEKFIERSFYVAHRASVWLVPKELKRDLLALLDDEHKDERLPKEEGQKEKEKQKDPAEPEHAA